MNLTREKELIKKWALENKSEKVFQECDVYTDSYFTDITSASYIMEYSFESAPQLENIFSDTWSRQQSDIIKKIIAISAIKNMPQTESIASVSTDSKIPHYIYTF